VSFLKEAETLRRKLSKLDERTTKRLEAATNRITEAHEQAKKDLLESCSAEAQELVSRAVELESEAG